jgi:sulfate adenylyltransferase subunit 2
MSLLDELEAESIYILREAYAQFQRPTILYSVGKDSSVVVHLARKAFFPKPLPFPLLHVDTGFDFPEMYEFRDWFVGKIGAKLLVYRNEEAISKNANPFDLGTFNCCDLLRTKALVQALKHFEVDAAIGGARREEEKSRAKERVFSFRDSFGQWEPKNQRPELWNLYNGRIKKGEGVRVFPLSNWTELDIWNYIDREDIPIVPLYFAAEREVIVRGDLLIPTVETRAGNGLLPGERVEKMMIRYRTLGCSPCTGAVRSEATTVRQIVQEMMVTNISERSTRIIDHDQEGSMEKKKREGYF